MTQCRSLSKLKSLIVKEILQIHLNDLNKLTLIIISFRFRVIFEMIKPDKLDGSTTLKGLQYIDVPGQMKKDYKIDFYAHKEGTVSAKVRWTVNYCIIYMKGFGASNARKCHWFSTRRICSRDAKQKQELRNVID